MRHLNFQVSTSGELLSLDGFNLDGLLTKALIGDSTATLKLPEVQWQHRDYANYTVPGLPINDWEVIRALELVYPRCKKVFLFPATELHGVIRREEIINRMSLDWENRFLKFLGDDRFCYGGGQYLDATMTECDKLLQNYLEMAEGFLLQYPNLYLVPVANRFLGEKVPMYFRAYSDLLQLDRVLNLDWLNPADPIWWIDDQGHLSFSGWTVLRNQLESV